MSTREKFKMGLIVAYVVAFGLVEISVISGILLAIGYKAWVHLIEPLACSLL